MTGARKLLTRRTQGNHIVYTTPYKGLHGTVTMPDQWYYDDSAMLTAVAQFPDGTTRTRKFHASTNAQNYVENRLIDGIRTIRRGSHGS